MFMLIHKNCNKYIKTSDPSVVSYTFSHIRKLYFTFPMSYYGL